MLDGYGLPCVVVAGWRHTNKVAYTSRRAFGRSTGESSNGRTSDSGSESWGSNPCSPANPIPQERDLERVSGDAQVHACGGSGANRPRFAQPHLRRGSATSSAREAQQTPSWFINCLHIVEMRARASSRCTAARGPVIAIGCRANGRQRFALRSHRSSAGELRALESPPPLAPPRLPRERTAMPAGCRAGLTLFGAKSSRAWPCADMHAYDGLWMGRARPVRHYSVRFVRNGVGPIWPSLALGWARRARRCCPLRRCQRPGRPVSCRGPASSASFLRSGR